jgi:ammonium transporter, Amt family
MPLRATPEQEAIGMDVVQHGEEAYVTGEGAILVTTEAGTGDFTPVKPPR